MSFAALQAKILALGNPTAVGLDARVEYVPAHILNKYTKAYGYGLEAAAEAILEFDSGLLEALRGIVPAVKPQSAYFENLGWRGMRVLEQLIVQAKQAGYYVIADIKRGDIGATATAYSEAWLGRTRVGEADIPIFDADCVTLNGYMGRDAVDPFLKDAEALDKAVFLLARTSNPSASDLQDALCGDAPVYERMGLLGADWAGDWLDAYGYSRVGAVTGATWPEQIRRLRALLPHTFFLVPGYGAQGGTAEDVRWAFDRNGHGAVVNSSRGILCAWQKTGHDGADYREAARDAALAMREDLRRTITLR